MTNKLDLTIANVSKRFFNSSFNNYYISSKLKQGQQAECLKRLKLYTTNIINYLNVEQQRNEFDATNFFESSLEKWLLLTGTAGTGKTHLSISILREIMLSGYSGLYTTYYELVTCRANDIRLKDKMKEVDFLIIDLFINYPSNTVMIDNEINDILTIRMGFNKPTVFITYFLESDTISHLDKLISFMSNPLYKELFKDNIILLDWEDYRRK